MLKYMKLFLFSLSVLLLLNGCSSANTTKNLFEFKDSYIGDNSAVVHIVHQLLHEEEFKKLKLQTKKQPYGIHLTYEDISGADNEREKVAIYNATFIFALIQNVDWIIFQFDNAEYKLTKEELEGWYGKQLSDFSNEKSLKELATNYLNDEEKVKKLFH
ncbi:DUF4825 domain-containing protein [Bacillus sp. 1780r2a1]|uniref:DUF4825 domain-containing protein n=1 Tax=Priestia sp. GS2 TaxID=3117403 RepID=UPI0021FD8222|nr:DUF4825 domain-containing protein [Bacillus sp. 1780r2a1]